MKPLVRRFVILTACWMTLGSATPAKTQNTHAQASYYWYWSDSDTIIFWESTAAACNDLYNMTGQITNTSAAGGTLVAKGYTNNTYPHNSSPWVLLYSH